MLGLTARAMPTSWPKTWTLAKMPYKDIEKQREANRKYYAENKQKKREACRKYYAENKQKIREASRKWRAENKEKDCETRRKWRAENKEKMYEAQRQWSKANPSKITKYSANRRATRLNATPAWLTDKQQTEMAAIYKEAVVMGKQTGIPHHVDHIVPLKGKNVSGLHVPWNLQILTATENISKGNRIK